MAEPKREAVPRFCREFIGDWADANQTAQPLGFHLTLKAYGRKVYGAIHETGVNRWFRMEVSPAWFCARGLVYERRGNKLIHVATVRLCHRRKERSLLWQVVGKDQSEVLPQEIVLWKRA